MIKQKNIVIKNSDATLDYTEMGDVIVNSSSTATITLPNPNKGLWYRVSNVAEDLVTIYYDGVITTLKETEQALLLSNDSTSWFFSKGGGAMTKAEIEAVFVGDNIETHFHDSRYYTETEIDNFFSAYSEDFIGLTDTPETYASHGGKLIKVKEDESGLEFTSADTFFDGNVKDEFEVVINLDCGGA